MTDVLPWPNDMTFSLAEFIAVVESRMKVAHETFGTTGTPDTAHPVGTTEPGL